MKQKLSIVVGFHLSWRTCLLAVFFALGTGFALDKDKITFGGVGWVQYGIITHSSDTVNFNYNGMPVQSSGSQLLLKASISEKLEGAAGLGVFEGHEFKDPIKGGGRIPIGVSPYIAEARFTYTFMEDVDRSLRLTGGLFPYNYNSNIQNLGLYLLRGNVYPGFLISGFETIHVLPIANTLGFWLEHKTGGFRHNLLIKSETDYLPRFDLSLAYIADYEMGPFSIGAGANFFRLLPIDKKLTSGFFPEFERDDSDVDHPYDRIFIHVNPVNNDTTVLSFQGTKLMMKVALDLQKVFGEMSILGPNDLRLYTEAAVIGLNTSEAYNTIYGGLGSRSPIMLGFNLPAFKLLDHLAIEVEYYGAKFQDNTKRLYPTTVEFQSSLPVSNASLLREPQIVTDSLGNIDTVDSQTGTPWEEANVERNISSDNWKWSLHGAKVIQNHFQVSFQVANDHFRPGGSGEAPQHQSAFTTLDDWYWMTKIAYFF